MLYLILADSGLELIPKDLGKHPSVGKNIKRFGNLGRILDISLHHSAMKSLKDTYSRGRPDIVHKFLIDSQASILNKLGLLRIFIHTYDDKLYEINPLLRPPKDYNRFKGIMVDVLKEGVLKIPVEQKIEKEASLTEENISKAESDKKLQSVYLESLKLYDQQLNEITNLGENTNGPPRQFLEQDHFIETENIILMRRMKKNLRKFIGSIHPNRIIFLTKNGKLTLPDEVFAKTSLNEHIVVILGGFQSGYFSDNVMRITGEKVSIFPAGLESGVVSNRILSNYENHIFKEIYKEK